MEIIFFFFSDAFYLQVMFLWLSGMSALSLNTQRHVLGMANDLWSVLQGEGSIQGDTQAGHCRSLVYLV